MAKAATIDDAGIGLLTMLLPFRCNICLAAARSISSHALLCVGSFWIEEMVEVLVGRRAPAVAGRRGRRAGSSMGWPTALFLGADALTVRPPAEVGCAPEAPQNVHGCGIGNRRVLWRGGWRGRRA